MLSSGASDKKIKIKCKTKLLIEAVRTLAVIYLVYPLPWNSVLLKFLMTVCCKEEDIGLLRSLGYYLKSCLIKLECVPLYCHMFERQ